MSLHIISGKIERQAKEFIYKYGRIAKITYLVSTSDCPSCGWDPINREAVKSNCSTCNGLGIIETNTVKSFKVIINKFSGTKSFIDFANHKINLMPEGEARITCLLSDVSTNRLSSTAETLFNRSYKSSQGKILIDGLNYVIKSSDKIGIEKPFFAIAVLDKVK